MIAARHRFAAVQHGYRSEALRQERSKLLAEQRRLLLAVDEASTPDRLEQAAVEMGLQPLRATQIETGAKSSQISTLRPSFAMLGAPGGTSLSR